MARSTFRVHFVRHDDGALTGRLLSAAGALSEPFSGYAADEAGVFAQLTLALEEASGSLDEYAWTQSLQLARVTVKVHPQSVIKRRVVIAKQQLQLRITYFWAEQPAGGFFVIVPRFGWWFMLESVDMAGAVIRQAIGSDLLGQQPRSVYDFRGVDEEWVVEWSPTLGAQRSRGADRGAEGGFRTLGAVAEDLTARERKSRRKPIVGTIDVSAHLPALLASPPRSLLLVGASGSGKTTWVRALARALQGLEDAEERVRIWSTTADRIVAGMRFLGQWEQRCLDLIEELSGEGDLLFVDKLAPLCSSQTGHSAIIDMFVPALRAGEVGLIAECSDREYQRLRSERPALIGLFRVVQVAPPPASVMPAQLAEYQRRIDPTTQLDGPALRQLVQLLDFFQRDVSFPGKGFRFLDWLGQERPAAGGDHPPRELDQGEVCRAYSRWSGLPLDLISDERPAGPDVIQARLQAGVIGQDAACRQAARVLTRFKTGLADPERPIGSLFFVGPTGVGKTELAKQLARYMFGASDRMIRLDMSEFMLAGSAARMLATGKGVSSLVEKVRQNPLSLVLLDEIEKAHAEVFDLLLAMLGEGRMTDDEGRFVDFRMTLVVMTSNLGVRTSGSAGFGGGGQSEQDLLGAVRGHFRPEFFNRIDHVVPFRNLSEEDILAIVDLEVRKAAERVGLVRRGLVLHVHDDARRALAKLGWHPTRGARPLARALEEHVMSPIAVRLAAERSLRDQRVHVVTSSSEALSGLRARGAFVIVVPD